MADSNCSNFWLRNTATATRLGFRVTIEIAERANTNTDEEIIVTAVA